VTEETRRILLGGAPAEMVLKDGVLVAADGRTIRTEDAVHLPPSEPSKIICVHLNYQNRIDELKTEGPPAPNYFFKPPSSLNSHKGVVIRPRGTRFLNYEGEVAVVIGKTARNIRVADALDYVEGYGLANDFAIHDFRHADRGSMLRVRARTPSPRSAPAWCAAGRRTTRCSARGSTARSSRSPASRAWSSRWPTLSPTSPA
jgi:5-oxopent-3-ene-1,2,5-tricarboxylate decarboxylase/2-hydroxyhepta-2,4-diene-1,7-dioate isomerase